MKITVNYMKAEPVLIRGHKCPPRDTTKDVHDSVLLYVEVWLMKHVSVPTPVTNPGATLALICVF